MPPTRLAAALCSGALLLAGCGSSRPGEDVAATAEASPSIESEAGEPSGTVEVAYTIPASTQGPLEAAAASFNERNTGLSIQPVQAGQTCTDLPERLQGDAVAGDLPEIAMLCLGSAKQFVESGLAQPLEPFLASDPEFGLDAFAEETLDAQRVDGTLYGLPVGLSVPILYYNADQFRAAGLDPDNPPSTFDEVEQAAAALADPAANRAGMLWMQFDTNLLFQAALESAGGRMANEDDTAPAFNSPEGAAVLRSWRELVEAGLMPVVTDATAAADMMARGDVAMMVQTNSRLSSIAKAADFELRTAPMPVPEDEARRALPMSGYAYVMLAQEEEQQRAAWEAMKELVSPGNVGGFVQATGFVPPIPSLVDEELREFYAENPNQATAARLIRDAVPTYEWPGTRTAEMQAILHDQIVLALNGAVSAEDALDAAAEQIQPLMTQ